jgi:hypothetical protein
LHFCTSALYQIPFHSSTPSQTNISKPQNLHKKQPGYLTEKKTKTTRQKGNKTPMTGLQKRRNLLSRPSRKAIIKDPLQVFVLVCHETELKDRKMKLTRIPGADLDQDMPSN